MMEFGTVAFGGHCNSIDITEVKIVVVTVDGIVIVNGTFPVRFSATGSPTHPATNSTAIITMHNATATRMGLIRLSEKIGRAVIGYKNSVQCGK